MMMIHHHQQHQHPTIEVPSWDPPYDDPTAQNNTPIFSPQTNAYFAALQRYLPSSTEYDSDESSSEFDSFACDNFRMYEFKVRKCARGRSHDWTECPYAHPGEKARRRDPRKYHYSGVACPEFRRGSCRKGDSCEFAHGVFECWLHPARYRTQPCKDGPHCKRRVCFFAHSPEQLRVVAHSESSPPPPPSRLAVDSPESPPLSPSYGGSFMRGVSVSPMYSPDSPPLSPANRWRVEGRAGGGDSLVGVMRGLQIGPRFGSSPRSPNGFGGYCGGGSLPATPTPATRSSGRVDPWEMVGMEEEEVPMERVESGKSIRARMYAKLSKENSLDRDRVDSVSNGPDFGWVSELVK